MLSDKQRSLTCLGEIFFALCKSVDSPVSLGCWLRFKYGEHDDLASLRLSPAMYRTAAAFRDDYMVVSYLSKYSGLNTTMDRRAVALDGFAAAEVQCKETNIRLRNCARGETNPRVEPVLLLAQQKIAQILGECDVSEALNKCDWGKGATSTLSSDEATLIRKMGSQGPISVTGRALPLLRAVIEHDPCWGSAIFHAEVVGPYSLLKSNFEIVEYNKVTTVPKDATKDRTIAAEPTGNIFLQLGVGRVLRSRLKKRCGIDLDDQCRNQKYARLGSISGEYATVDLKSASDTVSKELIYQLVPYEWVILLDSLRCSKGRLEGKEFVYEKFSSMGNGFTFELESLLFYSLAFAVARHLGLRDRVLVYGDDIIIPTGGYQLLVEVLLFCGFEVNPKKSFADGYFRESCGRHYWDGFDVTPVYQKEGLFEKGSRLLEEAYRCANRLIRLAHRRGNFDFLDSGLEKSWLAARRTLLLERPRHVIPLESQDDDGLALPKEELYRHCVHVNVHGQVKVPVYSFKPKKLSLSESQLGYLLAYWLRQSSHRNSGVSEFPFKGKLTLRRRGTYVSRRRLYPIGTANVAWM